MIKIYELDTVEFFLIIKIYELDTMGAMWLQGLKVLFFFVLKTLKTCALSYISTLWLLILKAVLQCAGCVSNRRLQTTNSFYWWIN